MRVFLSLETKFLWCQFLLMVFFWRRRNEFAGGGVDLEEGLDSGGGVPRVEELESSYLEQTLMNLTRIRGGIFPIFPQCFPRLCFFRIIILSNFYYLGKALLKLSNKLILYIEFKGFNSFFFLKFS